MKKFAILSGMMRGILAVAFIAGAALSSDAATKDVGYADVKQDPVYPYDGLSNSTDRSAYVGVKLTADMMKNYAGARITGFRMGWSCNYEGGEIDLFIREGDFNAPDKASKHASVVYKQNWNTIMLDEPYIIPDNPGDIMIGYHIDIKADMICIPYSVRGKKPANSFFVAYEDVKDPEGNIIWADISSQVDALLLLAIVEMDGDVANRAEIADIYTNGLQVTGHTDTGLYHITNQGTNPIRSLTLHFACGDKTEDIDVSLTSPIAVNTTSKVSLPVPTIATGTTTVSITKVNGKENTYKSSKTFDLVAVPEEVSELFERRSLLEYYGSENNHHNANNFDAYLWPGYKDYADRMSLVCHHLGDQFMTGDDEDTQMLIDFADGDKSKVFCPVVTIDRTVLPGNVIIRDKTVAFAVPSPQYAFNLYNAALAIPTFASIEVTSAYNADRQELGIDVSGTVTDGILPAGEKLKLTVYVLEDNVASTSQNWATPEQEAEYGGVYNHMAVIRQQPVPTWGDELDGAGDFARNYTVAIDPEEWKTSDMRVVALLHRSENNASTGRQVINCAENSFDSSAIRAITADGEGAVITVTADRGVAVNGSTEGVRVFTTSGALTSNHGLVPGIYVVSTGNLTSKIFVK